MRRAGNGKRNRVGTVGGMAGGDVPVAGTGSCGWHGSWALLALGAAAPRGGEAVLGDGVTAGGSDPRPAPGAPRAPRAAICAGGGGTFVPSSGSLQGVSGTSVPSLGLAPITARP